MLTTSLPLFTGTRKQAKGQETNETLQKVAGKVHSVPQTIQLRTFFATVNGLLSGVLTLSPNSCLNQSLFLFNGYRCHLEAEWAGCEVDR
jgi:hypothetical protein